MTTTRRRLQRGLVLLALVALLATACGDSTTSDRQDASTDSTTATNDTTPEVADEPMTTPDTPEPPQTIPKSTPVAPEDVEINRDVPYGTTRRKNHRELPLLDVAYGSDPAHRLGIHLPVESNGLAVLWLHAGGWTSGNRTGTGPVADQLVADGATVFSADYRLTPDHVFRAQIHDVKRAIRWIKCHRSDFPYRRLVVAGASAGGHLAALAATSAGALEPTDLPPQLAAHDSSVDGAVSLSGPMDLTRFWQADHPWARPLSDGFLDCDSATCDRDWMIQASPVHWVDPTDPPLYLAAGTADTLVTAVDNADRMWDVVQAQGDPARCWYDRVDAGTHNLWDTLDLTGLQQFLANFDLVLPAVTVSV